MYKQIDWKDHVTEHPNRRIIHDNGDGSVDLIKDQGTVIQEGYGFSFIFFIRSNYKIHFNDQQKTTV